MRTIDEMTREQLVIIYCLGEIEILREKGLIDGGRYKLKIGGDCIYQMLKQSGFKPTPDEIRDCMKILREAPA